MDGGSYNYIYEFIVSVCGNFIKYWKVVNIIPFEFQLKK